MTVAQPTPMRCDECQRPMAKAKRTHGGRRFCGTCYPKLFKRLLCSGCGNFARLPVFNESAKCRQCELSVACVRCNRTGRPVGMITPDGPACNSCAHHFRAPEPCDKCGTLSTRLTRVLSIDASARCCPKCVRKSSATCPCCRRHRKLLCGPDGHMRCKACVEQGSISCASCGESMPAGRKKDCESCAWKAAFHRRARVCRELLDQAHTRNLFDKFCIWLNQHMGAHKAFLKLKSYLPFFRFLKTQSTGIPPYVSLLGHFQADGLRRMQTPMLWLEERYGVVADDALREEHSEKRRIDELINSLPDGTASKMLLGYRSYLLSKQGEGSTTFRSIRLALRAAKGVLETASATFDAVPTQKTFTRYMTLVPGQKAAAQGFVSYLNRTHNLGLELTVSDRAKAHARTQRLENELSAMIASGGDGKAFERTWIKIALMHFHGVRRVNKKKLVYVPFTVLGKEGFNVKLETIDYWVPGHSATR